ncbi:helix-turn-helix domain-containing protein [Rhodococcus sp. 5A-K4]|uniref:helix-turn-helix domain-containing protein n=1 Tax=Rhodococcus sp. 5A-K4 TaxID=3384442 RepID=UPI0038D416A2
MDIDDVGADGGREFLRDRLDELFADRHLTNRKVADALRVAGCQISKVYVSQLRSGARSNPSATMVSALAAYFEVPRDYFFATRWSDERDRVQSVDHDAALVDGLPESGLKKLLTSAIGLSGSQLRLLEALATELGRAERRPG